MNIRNVVSAAFLAATLMHAPAVYAWDGAKSGKIAAFHTTCCGNYDLRVYLDGPGMMCTGSSENFAYLNVSAGNYQAMASMLMSAWLAGKTVMIYTTNVGGYCEIGYIVVN